MKYEFENNLILFFEELSPDDTIGELLDKSNRNFRSINLNASGPIGRRGEPGFSSGRGNPGPPGASFNDIFIFTRTKNFSNEFNQRIPDRIINTRTDLGLLLSNLEGDTPTQLKPNEDGISTLTTIFESELFQQYKLKIYNGKSSTGEGKMVHFLNTTAVNRNIRYLEKSGFTVNLDFDGLGKEIFVFEFQKNSNIQNHSSLMKVITDEITLQSPKQTQILSLQSGKSTNPKSKGSLFPENNLPKECSWILPPLSGYVSIFENILQVGQGFEVVGTINNPNDFFVEYQEYTRNNVVNKTYYYDTDQSKNYIELFDKSSLKFKKFGNFIIIQYEFYLRKTNIALLPFDVRGLTIKVNKSFVSAENSIWTNGNTMKKTTTVEWSDIDYGYSTLVNSHLVRAVPRSTLFQNDTFSLAFNFLTNSTGLSYTNQNVEYLLSGQLIAEAGQLLDYDKNRAPALELIKV